jgi:peptide/nickel transport system ATP-binding protein
MEALLSAENLVKEYATRNLSGMKKRVRALDQVSFAIQPGARTAIVGASGSGKSTLATCLACLEKPDAGTIRFQSSEVTRLSERELRTIRPQVQLVFQDPAMAFNPFFMVWEILEEPWILRKKLDTAERRERAADLLARVGLSSGFLVRRPKDLSGGQRQRLAIARALALDPKVLIFDEALSALDYSVQAQIVNLLLELSDRSIPAMQRVALVFITHDIAMAARIADEIIVMHGGRIVERGPARQIIETPEQHATRALLAGALGPISMSQKRPTA